MTKIRDLVDKAYQEALGYGEDVEAGHLVYEGKEYYYPAGGGYAIRKTEIENNPAFERIEDDPHTPEYYNDKKYTEHDMQTALANQRQP